MDSSDSESDYNSGKESDLDFNKDSESSEEEVITLKHRYYFMVNLLIANF